MFHQIQVQTVWYQYDYDQEPITREGASNQRNYQVSIITLQNSIYGFELPAFAVYCRGVHIRLRMTSSVIVICCELDCMS